MATQVYEWHKEPGPANERVHLKIIEGDIDAGQIDAALQPLGYRLFGGPGGNTLGTWQVWRSNPAPDARHKFTSSDLGQVMQYCFQQIPGFQNEVVKLADSLAGEDLDKIKRSLTGHGWSMVRDIAKHLNDNPAVAALHPQSTDVDNIEGRVKDLVQMWTQQRETLKEMQGRLQLKQDQITDLNQQVQDRGATINALESKLTSVNAQVSRLRGVTNGISEFLADNGGSFEPNTTLLERVKGFFEAHLTLEKESSRHQAAEQGHWKTVVDHLKRAGFCQSRGVAEYIPDVVGQAITELVSIRHFSKGNDEAAKQIAIIKGAIENDAILKARLWNYTGKTVADEVKSIIAMWHTQRKRITAMADGDNPDKRQPQMEIVINSTSDASKRIREILDDMKDRPIFSLRRPI